MPSWHHSAPLRKGSFLSSPPFSSSSSSSSFLAVRRAALARATAGGGSGWRWKEERLDLDYRKIMEGLRLGLRRRSAFSPRASRLHQRWPADGGGKFLAADPDRRPFRRCVQLGERWDEGRINWHSSGEREREKWREPDWEVASLTPCLTLFLVNKCSVPRLPGWSSAGRRKSLSLCSQMKSVQNESTFCFIIAAAPNSGSSFVATENNDTKCVVSSRNASKMSFKSTS